MSLAKIKVLRASKDKYDREEAIRLLNDHLVKKPKDVEAWYDKASCHDYLGEEDVAEKSYAKVYDLGWEKLAAKDQPSFFVGYGSTLRNLLKFKKSAKILKEGIELFPSHAALKVFLAFTEYSMNNATSAANHLFEAIVQSSGKGLDGYERAIDWYVKNLEVHPVIRTNQKNR